MGTARDLENSIREELFSHVLNLDPAYYDKTKTGDIMAHATSDINHVRMAFGFGLIAIVDTVLLGGAALVIMLWTHPLLTAIAMIPMPFLMFTTKILGKKMHILHKTAQESFSKLTELIRESFFGIRIIKVYNFESIISGKINSASKDYFKKNMKRAYASAFLKPFLILFFNLSTLIILFYGGFLVIKKSISPGELVAFLQYLGILAWPIIAIGWMTNLFQRGMASLKRINMLLNASPDVISAKTPVEVKNLSGDVCFKKVGFAYGNGEPVLLDIDFSVNPGMSIGITGPPGSGKTTLIQLIPRLYNPTSGQLLMDGHDITQMDLSFLRSQIAFMPQESFLFSTTIKENILLGRAIEDERLNRIIDGCCLKETLEKMPDGIDTVVGERGVTLSGGQKQRIALARALIDESPIIILDDPISQVDTHTAARLMKTIGHMNREASLIMISHRISTLAHCHTIYVMENGRIAACGSHTELIQYNRFYRESYRVQQLEEEMKKNV